MKRSEFLISLGALIVAPFLPRQKPIRMPRNWNHGGTHDDRPNVFSRKVSPETIRTIKEANHRYWQTHSEFKIEDLKWLRDYYGRLAEDITKRYSL